MRGSLFVPVFIPLLACEPPTQTGAVSVAKNVQASTQIERVGPADEDFVTVARGERIGFSARASDSDGDLKGSEWYLNGAYLGTQLVTSLPGATGSAAVFWRGINFPEPGEHVVEVLAFDEVYHYSPAARWDIQVTERPRMMYVDRTDERIATDAGIAGIAAFAQNHGFNHVALYRLHVILPNPTLTARLPLLLNALRAAGVSRVLAVVGSVADVDRTREYLASDHASDPVARFDGLLSEYEFWRAGQTFRGYARLLAHMRALADQTSILVATYLGWFDDFHVGTVTALCDIVLLHAYVQKPDLAYPYLTSRLALLSYDFGQPTMVWPIFSAEVTEGDAGETPFMGTWLASHRDEKPLELAASIVLQDFRTDPGEFRNGLRLGGFAWFAARHLEQALEPPP